MQPERHTYKGHRVELRRPDDDLTAREVEYGAQPELLIDGQSVRYGQLPDGSYALHEYAYDWDEDLIELPCISCRRDDPPRAGHPTAVAKVAADRGEGESARTPVPVLGPRRRLPAEPSP
jgi:hypothetical protein